MKIFLLLNQLTAVSGRVVRVNVRLVAGVGHARAGGGAVRPGRHRPRLEAVLTTADLRC